MCPGRARAFLFPQRRASNSISLSRAMVLPADVSKGDDLFLDLSSWGVVARLLGHSRTPQYLLGWQVQPLLVPQAGVPRGMGQQPPLPSPPSALFSGALFQ